MRVLIITEAGTTLPSGYVRALIYREHFREDGVSVRYESRLPDLAALRMSPVGTKIVARVMAGWLGRALTRRRARRLLKLANEYDTVYLQKISDSRFIHALKRSGHARLVYDLNDAQWLPARSEFLQGGLDDILSLADAVTCDNPYGCEYAARSNSHCHLVPDPSQVEEFDLRRPVRRPVTARVVLGWVGSPASSFHLFAIWEALEEIGLRFPEVSLRLLGVGHRHEGMPPFEHIRYSVLPAYSKEEMIDEVCRMDIGLFPLFNVEDAHARGVLKAEIYMAGGLCIVASPVGQVPSVITDGRNGLLAHSTGEWVDKLTSAISDHHLRLRLADEALSTARREFSLPACYRSLKAALQP